MQKNCFLGAEGLTVQTLELECLVKRILFSPNSEFPRYTNGLNIFSDFPYGKTGRALEHNGAFYYYSSGNDFPMGFSPVKVIIFLQAEVRNILGHLPVLD